jgi:hypothetical protein
MPVTNRAYNLNTGNKWVAVIPFKLIDPDLSVDNVAFNLVNFTTPALEIGTAEFPIQGRDIPLPTGVQNEDKSLIFNYMMSSDWHQYKILYKWFNQISDENNAPQDTYDQLVLPISIFFLSEFKTPLFSMNFEGCWISNLQDIDLNYQQGEENIQHSFTIRYATYSFDNLL